ncbi:hypothetical protein C806_03138 [Lachnospiraceae bacterium 3-1]|nr:hypothetical protein C806_03138 [Lachnospiraceae bacterium 3-1]
MKIRKHVWNILFLSLIGIMSLAGVALAAKPKEVQIAFTHDLHSHLEPFYLSEGEEEKLVGGTARIMSYLQEQRTQNENLLYLDGGDFSMGTLYQTVYTTQAAELRMLGVLGADATTFGNHEFDYRSNGLAQMLQAAKDSGDTLPSLVVCNIDWEATLAGEQAEDGALLQKAFEAYGVEPYIIIEKGGVKIAVIGVFGTDALACAPTCALSFRDPIEAVGETVAEIREQEKADMIVCVSHSGTWEDEEKSEDELLAKGVPELDLIVSGHTHSILEEPIVHGDTVIVSTGEYGARVGNLRMIQKENGRWSLEDYQLDLMDENYKEEPKAVEKIQELGQTIDEDYLAQFGFTKDQVLARNPWEFTKINGLGEKLQEEPLGNLLADSYLYTVNNSDTGDENQALVAIVPSGCIRETFHKEKDITVADAFQTLSLGIGPDGVPGYPLVSVYFTGKELKTIAEVDASISPIMTTAQLYASGLTYTANPNRMILNKVTDVKLQDMEGNVQELEDDKLYRLVADLYSGQMMGAVTDQSYGILSIVPKDAQGNEIPIENLEDHIVYTDGQELKAWVCVAKYLDSFEESTKEAEIPEYYSTTHNRKNIENNKSLGAIVKNPNKIAVAAFCIVTGVILLLIFAIVLIVRAVKKRNQVRRKKF